MISHVKHTLTRKIVRFYELTRDFNNLVSHYENVEPQHVNPKLLCGSYHAEISLHFSWDVENINIHSNI